MYFKHLNCKVEKTLSENGIACCTCSIGTDCPEGFEGEVQTDCFKGYGLNHVVNEVMSKNTLVLNRLAGIVEKFKEAEDRAEVKGQTKLLPTTIKETIDKVKTLLQEAMDTIGQPDKTGYKIIQCIELLEKLEVE